MFRKEFLLIFLLVLPIVTAHDIIVIDNTLEINTNKVVFHNDGSLATVLNDYKKEVSEKLIIKNNDKICSPTKFSSEKDPIAGFSVEFLCEEQVDNLTVNDSLLSKLQLQVNTVYKVKVGNERKTFVGEKQISFEVNKSSEDENIFLKYLKLGVGHILSGWDHIFFILGFIVIASNFSSLVKNISGFTLSHSITLALAATGIFFLPAKIVEPLIALSIVVVGLLGLFNIEKVSKFWLIFFFGFFHGLGFAGAIAEVGFPKIGFLTALVGFNFGVEVGQLLIVCLVYPFIYWIGKDSQVRKIRVKQLVCFIVVGAGLFWLINRIGVF